MSATPSRYDTNSRVAAWLAYVGSPDLRTFQKTAGLAVDGVFGQKTFVALRDAFRSRLAAICEVSSFATPIRCQADMYEGGYDFFTLRPDAALYYMALREKVRAAGAIITSAGSDRPLSAKVSAGRVPTSLHYLAIAFDLHTGSALQNPASDPFVCELVGKTWTVWARCNPETAAPDSLPEKRTIEKPVVYKYKKGWGYDKPVTDHFFNFTEAAASFGFAAIAPHDAFLQRHVYMSAEWWHFQFEFGLMPNYSTFYDELRVRYTDAQLARSPLASAMNNRVFGRNWF